MGQDANFGLGERNELTTEKYDDVLIHVNGRCNLRAIRSACEQKKNARHGEWFSPMMG
jgi:hypothetical protein